MDDAGQIRLELVTSALRNLLDITEGMQRDAEDWIAALPERDRKRYCWGEGSMLDNAINDARHALQISYGVESTIPHRLVEGWRDQSLARSAEHILEQDIELRR